MSNITASLYFVGFYKHGALQSVVAGPFGSEEEAETALTKMDLSPPGLFPSSRSARYVICVAEIPVRMIGEDNDT